MSIRTGDPVDGFVLPAAPGEAVDVGEVIGSKPVVLLFVPLAFSGVCTAEFCSLRDDWARWSALDAAVYGISVDSPFATAKWRADESIPFPVLSDFNKTVSERFGVLDEDFFGLRGVAKRSVFVIGTDGIVAYDWITDDAGVQVDFDRLEQAIREAPGG